MFKQSRFFIHLIGRFRRFLLVHFGKEYVAGRLLEREGECRQCGTCCRMFIPHFMITKKNRCVIHNSCRWKVCRAFPIDQRDIDEVALEGAICGYRFGTGPAENRPQAEGL